MLKFYRWQNNIRFVTTIQPRSYVPTMATKDIISCLLQTIVSTNFYNCVSNRHVTNIKQLYYINQQKKTKLWTKLWILLIHKNSLILKPNEIFEKHLKAARHDIALLDKRRWYRPNLIPTGRTKSHVFLPFQLSGNTFSFVEELARNGPVNYQFSREG